MPINPNIILGVQQPKFQMADPLESASRALQIQGLMGQQDLQGMQMRQAQQAEADDLATREAFKAGGDRKAIIDRLMGAGQYKPAQALEKADLDRRKGLADINKTELEGAAKRAQIYRDVISGVRDDASYQAALQNPIVAAELKDRGGAPATFDPNWQRTQVLTAEKFLDAVKPHITMVNDGKTTRFVDTNAFSNPNVTNTTIAMQTTPDADQTDRRTREEGAANRGVTIRGQNMTDSRSREANTISREANATTYDADRGVLVNRATGEARPAMQGGQPIGPRDKDLTDSQSKALLFGTRMQEAEKIFGDLSKKGVTTAIPGATAGYGVGAAINFAASPNQQSLVQAKRDFINAVLRRESGAVISPSEFDNAEKQYFPQVGDSPQVIAQKTANRKIAAEGIMQEVPQRRRPQQQGAVNPGAADPQIEALLKKYGG